MERSWPVRKVQFPAHLDDSAQLGVDSTGRLLQRHAYNNTYHVVTGAKDYGPNTPFHLTCERRPTLPGLARRSRRADRWLLALLVLLVVALLTRCAPAHSAPPLPAEPRDYRAEHAAPVHGHYDWYESDTLDQ